MAGVLQPISSSVFNLEQSERKKGGPVCPPKPKERKFKKGVHVWIHDETEVWCKATIIKRPGSNKSMVVQHARTGKEVVVKVVDNYPLLCGVSNDWKQLDDLTQLNPLHEAAVLECLRSRCQSDQYYTKAGITLIAINPFKEIPGLYDKQTIHHYRNKEQDEEPHVFRVAEDAFNEMTRGVGFTNQSVIVSGESGAGKTWTARCLMKYLTSVAVPFNPGGFNPSPADCIEKRILESNPLLEAFGNAATARNQNSSRFGKYIQLQFDRGNHIVGALIQTYLLEKTRVVHQAEKECNFHIFYQLLYGTSREEQENWGLSRYGSDELQTFGFLQNRHKGTVTSDDGADLPSTRSALCNVGIVTSQQQDIFQLLSGILHLGNLLFVSDEDLDPCDIDDSDIGSEHSLKFASQLLGVDSKSLVQSIIFRQITASHSTRRKSVFMKPCTVEEASTRRDCLAKLIYSRLFDWLVSTINRTTCAGKWHSFIGLLDIYGFESFHSNSLEQLCINYANEKLQQHFVTHFLRAEQEEYQAEGIPWNFCSFTDNRPCLEAIEGKISVFTLMNEECNLNRQSNPLVFSQRLLDILNTPYISKPHRSYEQPAFVVKHYAEPVTYHVHGLVEKNKDNLPEDLVQLLHKSSNSFVRQLVEIESSTMHATQKGKSRKPTAKTVAAKFKVSLDSLMSTLNHTRPHYIRCIKPNNTNQPDVMDSQYVVCQLRACGVLETIQISAAGFPSKLGYAEFWQRYKMLLKTTEIPIMPSKSLCADVIQTVFGDEGKENDVKQALYGNSKVFLPDGKLEQLECLRADVLLKSAKCLQQAWRQYLERRDARDAMVMQWAATTIQAGFRGWKARCDIEKMHDAARIIQHAILMYCYRRQEERQLNEQIGESTSDESLSSANSSSSEVFNTQDSTMDKMDANHDYANNMNNQSKPCSLVMSGYSRPTAVASGIAVLRSSSSPETSIGLSLASGIAVLRSSSSSSLETSIGLSLATASTKLSENFSNSVSCNFEEEIDGIEDDNCDNDDDNSNASDPSQTKDSLLMSMLKMPAVDIALGVAITALIVRGPMKW